jgi:drug/metabolite transporter (DMT)-like permease
MAESTNRRRQLGADLALLMVTLIWGGTFVMVKDATSGYPVFGFLAIRFALALAGLLAIGGRRLRTLNRRNVASGILLGLFLLAGYAFQTLGLQHTTASKAGFITGLNVAIVPVLAALVLKRLPQRAAVLGVLLATTGMALLSLDNSLRLGQGDLLVLLCALAFALHIVGVSAFAPGVDPIALTIVQVAVVAILSSGIALAGGQAWPAPTPTVWGAAAFTGILATAVAFGVQTAAQRFTTPTHTALIFTAEPVFAALFGVLLANDLLTTRMIVGGALVLAGMLVSEIPWSERTAGLISRFMAPQYVITLLLILLGFADPISWQRGITWVLVVMLPFVGITLWVFIRALRRGTISDWHITNRRERLDPGIVAASLILTATPMAILFLFDGPRWILALTFSGFLLMVINLVITFIWKISQHVSGIALGATLATVTLGPLAAPSLLLIPLVAWARVKVGAHTVMQTIVGGLTGVLITMFALGLLGLGQLAR